VSYGDGSRTLDGPALVAWLTDEIAPHSLTTEAYWRGDTIERAIRRWRAGQYAHVDAADRVLAALGIPIALVPDEIWRPARRHRPRASVVSR
jgi:hypothetical protein